MLRFIKKLFRTELERVRQKQNFRRALKSLDASVEQFNKRSIYRRLTDAIIDQTPDERLVQTVFDQISEQIGEIPGDEYDTVLQLTEGQQAIYMVWALEAEVNNGGYNQYYTNASGQFAYFTPNALLRIGATRFADLMQQVNRTFEEDNALITALQDGTVEGFSESYQDNPLNPYDDQFYALYAYEKLDQLMIQYIRGHKDEFTRAE